MKPITLLIAIVTLTTFSCKKEIEYKYAENEEVLTCDDPNINNKLFKEALYSFEDYIKGHSRSAQNSVLGGYQYYINIGTSPDALPFAPTISEHVQDVFEALKDEKDLWVEENGKHHLNYNHPILECIGDNIKNKGYQETYKALLSTNSMSPKLFGTPFRTQAGQIFRDKSIATYVALDMFYAKLFEIDFSKVDPLQKEEPVEAPLLKKEGATPIDHSGHNHN